MRVLMFGWEFPPHISGGLGTACKGIVDALGMRGDTSLVFVAPKIFGDEQSVNTVFAGADRYAKTHKKILDRNIRIVLPQPSPEQNITNQDELVKYVAESDKLIYIETASYLHPYLQPGQIERILMRKNIPPEKVYVDPDGRLVTIENGRKKPISVSIGDTVDNNTQKPAKFEFTGGYTSDIFTETGMFARIGGKIANQHNFDVIHAHDWLTYEAGIAAKKATGKPLVVHVHATEYDRTGNHPNPQVFAIEKDGMEQADAVITVSNLTRDIVIDKYGIDPDKVFAIYNGVDFKPDRHKYKKPDGEKLVTFLGRITYQKGPRYFIEAAFKVLKQLRNVRFVMAGGGDMFNQMVTAAARLGISDRFHFTDFLNHDEVRHLLAVSDIYVMPSVQEPFGIAPLEAVRCNVPVIISKQSGVAEVLKHAIKVDYNDVDAIADAIHALIEYPAISKHIVKAAQRELRSLKWKESAKQISAVYNALCNNQNTEI